MNAVDRAKRDALIERLHKQNVPQVEISRRVGLNPERVHDVLCARGALPPARKVKQGTTTCWDFEDVNRIRKAIWRKQREGAREALAAMRQG